MASNILRAVLRGKEVKEFPLDGLLVLRAEASTTYSVVDSESYNIAGGVVLKKSGEALRVEVEGEVVATIDNFYGPGMEEVSFIAPASQVETAEVAPSLLEGAGSASEAATTDGVDGGSRALWEPVAASFSSGGSGVFASITSMTPSVAAAGLVVVVGGPAYILDQIDEEHKPPESDPTGVVVFDLVSGVSSSHSSMTFDAGKSYSIYIRVDSTAAQLNTANEGSTGGTWNTWSGAFNLGADDTITLVGNGSPIIAGTSGAVTTISITTSGSSMAWSNAASSAAAILLGSGWFARFGTSTTITTTSTIFSIITNTHVITTSASSSVTLWTNTASLSALRSTNHLSAHLTAMPAGILTSQGLV